MQNVKEKNSIRKTVLNKRLNLSRQEVTNLSSLICCKLFTNFNLIDNLIGVYMPIKNEVNLIFLKDYGINNFALPKIINNEIVFKKWCYGSPLEVKKYNILEPFETSETVTPKIILTPLLAFDLNLNRIGYGGGFYDKYLSNFKGIKIGVAFEMQKYNSLPYENFDIKLDYIITENNIYF